MYSVATAVEYDDAIEDWAASPDDVHETVVVRLEAARLWRAMRRMPEFDRHLLLMLYGLANDSEPVTIAELSRQLGCSRTQVGRMRRRVLARLHEVFIRDIAA